MVHKMLVVIALSTATVGEVDLDASYLVLNSYMNFCHAKFSLMDTTHGITYNMYVIVKF